MMDYQSLRAAHIIGAFISNLPHIVGNFNRGFQVVIFIFLSVFLVFLLGFSLLMLIRLYFFVRSLKEEEVYLELTPPSITEQSAYSTEQLFLLIHTLGNQKSFLERLLNLKPRFSLEIVSTKSEGIRYLLKTNKKEAGALKKSILSYLPQVKIQKVNDYLIMEPSFSKFKIVEFRLSNHFAYPLKSQQTLGLHDPISYITGMMTKLEKDELVALQIVLTSTKNKKINEISNLILRNYDVLDFLKNDKDFGLLTPIIALGKILISFVFIVFSIPFWILSNITTNGKASFPKLPFQKPGTLYKPSIHEQEIISSVKSKIEQGLFETSIRLLVLCNNQVDSNERIRGIKSSFSSFNSPEHQSVVSDRNSRFKFLKQYQLFTFKKRLLSFFNKSIFSVSEISGIYHFPYTSNTKTENIVKTYSKELPAPLSLKGERALDVVFAKNTYGGTSTLIGLSEEEREKHMYIIACIMVLYGGPGKERSDYSSKFVRVEAEIFVTKPGDMDTTHIELAVRDGIESRIDELRNQNPREVDAGTMNVSPSRKRISVGLDSMSLGLPVEKASKKARKRTVEVFLEQGKGYSVGSF